MSTTKKKPKPMTQREKKLRAETKKQLQEDGVLPPDKPRLNRKKFARETIAEFEALNIDPWEMSIAFHAVTRAMVSENMHEVTSEQVGVLKLLKLIVEYEKFKNAKKETGESTYTLGEFFDTVINL